MRKKENTGPMNFFRFLFSKVFLKNLLIAIALIAILIFAAFKFLNLYTSHGKEIELPDFSGMTMEELSEFSAGKTLVFEILDSVHATGKPRGTVLTQNPLPGSMVKKKRKVYLTVVAVLPEQVSMPNLIDLSHRQAIAMLETYGLKAGKLVYKPDIAENAVLEQKFKGRTIESGTMIEKGSSIELVLGKGIGNEKVQVPNLFGTTRKEAHTLIIENSLNVGAELYDKPSDSVNGKVYRQSPSSSSENKVNMGKSVDLWFSSDPDKFPEETENEEELSL